MLDPFIHPIRERILPKRCIQPRTFYTDRMSIWYYSGMVGR